MWNRPLAALIASVSFSICTFALVLGVADLAGVSARLEMQTWEARGRVGDSARQDSVRRRLELARRINTFNADYSADLGRFFEWQSWAQPLMSARHDGFRNAAESLYRETLSIRPSWGYAWAHFAENRLLQGYVDDELFNALARAMELAPWEPAVQRKVAWIGMALWKEIPNDMRPMVKDSIQRAVDLDVYRFEVIQLAIQFDWLEHLEPMLNTAAQKRTRDYVMKRLEPR